MKIKKRLDVLLTEQGYADSRSKAHAIIMAGPSTEAAAGAPGHEPHHCH